MERLTQMFSSLPQGIPPNAAGGRMASAFKRVFDLRLVPFGKAESPLGDAVMRLKVNTVEQIHGVAK
jgi:hypothetical protein